MSQVRTDQYVAEHVRPATGESGGSLSRILCRSSQPPARDPRIYRTPLSLLGIRLTPPPFSLPQTDASRAQTLELQIQARVAEELKRLQGLEAARLRETQEKLSEPADQASEAGGQPLSSHAVSKEVEKLRTKLEGRKKVRELPEAVETARSEVVRCLRENDRRPLDCWREVERFKEEVRRLEGAWVDKVVS